MLDKVIQLSKLEIFANDDIGRVLFVVVLLALIIATIIFLKLSISGTVKVWTVLCTTIKETSTRLKEQQTEQLKITGGEQKSGFN